MTKKKIGVNGTHNGRGKYCLLQNAVTEGIPQRKESKVLPT